MRLILFPLITLFLNLPTLAAAEMIKATASFSILGDIVERVGGDLVDVSSIVGPDSDAHTYSPTVGDARAVAKAVAMHMGNSATLRFFQGGVT